ncbi:hypothetical protein ACWKWU_16485 [Chitinophaga lutea]
MIFKLYQLFQLLSLLAAIFCFKGLSRFSIAAFLPLLLLVNVIEFIGTNFRLFGWAHNYFIYNIFTLLATPLQLILFGRMLGLKKNEKPVFLLISLLCMLIIVINFIWLQGWYQFNTISLILVEILTIVFSCFVLLRVTVQGSEEMALLQEPYFWINAARLLFALITLVLLGLQQVIRNNNIEIGQKSLYHAILPGANIVLYSAYTYAFILCRKKTR